MSKRPLQYAAAYENKYFVFVFLLFDKNWLIFMIIHRKLWRHLVGYKISNLIDIPFLLVIRMPNDDVSRAR